LHQWLETLQRPSQSGLSTPGCQRTRHPLAPNRPGADAACGIASISVRPPIFRTRIAAATMETLPAGGRAARVLRDRDPVFRDAAFRFELGLRFMCTSR
jgi:hypothetical protein